MTKSIYWTKKDFKFDISTNKYSVKTINNWENNTKKKAVIYIRVSSDKQTGKHGWHWLEAQLRATTDWCDKNNIEIEEIFRDEGKTWKTFNRKWFNDCLEFIRSKNKNWKNITYFVTTESSRISRSYDFKETVNTDAEIESLWVEIKTVLQQIDTSTDEWNMMKYMSYLFGAYESKKISKRTINSMVSRMKEWYFVLPLPCWYKYKKTRHWNTENSVAELDEVNANIIKDWLIKFANWEDIFNLSWLTKYLNHKNLSSNHWHRKPWKLRIEFTRRLVQPDKLMFYAWYIIKPEWWINEPVKWKHQSIIDLDIVHKILKKIKSPDGKTFEPRIDKRDDFPLRGLIRCNCCKYKLTSRYSKWRNWKYPYYWCNNPDCWEKFSISKDKLHKEFDQLLEKVAPTPETFKEFEKILKETWNNKKWIIEDINNNKLVEIDKINKEIDEIIYKVSKLSNELILNRLEERLTILQKQKQEIEYTLNHKEQNELNYDDLFKQATIIFKNPLAIWELWDLEIKQMLIMVLYNNEIYYKKNEGLRTPHISVLFKSLSGLCIKNSHMGRSTGFEPATTSATNWGSTNWATTATKIWCNW